MSKNVSNVPKIVKTKTILIYIIKENHIHDRFLKCLLTFTSASYDICVSKKGSA